MNKNVKIAKQLLKLAKNLIALDEEGDGSGFQVLHDMKNQGINNIANQKGYYKNFTGTIDWRGTYGKVKNASFQLGIFGHSNYPVMNGACFTWYDGIWEKGIWKAGIWKNGTWENGTWENGMWIDGRWEKGTWEDGTWENGTWENGMWIYGRWEKGIWKGGCDQNFNRHKDSPDKWED